jgi:hypothetical protein
MEQILEQRKNKISRLGEIGEKIIRNMFSSQGLKVEDSLDVYDNKKDMTVYEEEYDEVSFTLIVNKKTIEVKVNTPYVDKKAVTIRENQLKKCRGVDELYFITIPHKTMEYKYSGWILKVDPKTFECEPYPQPDKYEPSGTRRMLAIKVGQPATTRIRKLTEIELEQLLKYRISGE